MPTFEPISREKMRLVRSLSRRRERERRGLYLLEGMRLVRETVGEQSQLQFVFGTPSQLDILASESHPGPMYSVEPGSDLFLTDTSQEIGAVCRRKSVEVERLLTTPGPLLLLDGLSDPGNVGTIIRAADWFGLEGILATAGTVDPWNPKSVRATMGGILRCPVGVDLDPAVLAGSERPVIGLEAVADEELGRSLLPKTGIYVIGSEASGLSPQIRSICSGFLSIPGGGGESLNAAMAATLLVWELFRLDQ